MPIEESKYIWMNGELVPWREARIHILSHVIHYGSGVFEGIRCYRTKRGPAVFRLGDHIRRLFHSAKAYFMEIPYTQEELQKACVEVVRANGLEECYIRPIVYRGYGKMGLNPLNCPVEVAVAAWRWGRYLGRAFEEGARVIVSSWRRISSETLPTTAKGCGHYLNSQLAKVEAIKAGCDEAIMLNVDGYVSEGTGENFFIVRDGVLYTPPVEASILPGITRDTVMRLASDMGYRVVERFMSRGEIYTADECFFTGTAVEIVPVVVVDGRPIGDGKPGPVTRRIQEAYLRVVRGEDSRYEDWLTYV
mgnify:CR=1 FL=1